MAEEFKASIVEVSKDLSAKERVQIKDTTDSVKLDKATSEGMDLEIDVDFYAILHIENPRAEDKEYNTYVIVDTQGMKYTTGSDSFWRSFKNIWDEMKGIDDPWKIRVYRMASTKREGKTFITCALI